MSRQTHFVNALTSPRGMGAAVAAAVAAIGWLVWQPVAAGVLQDDGIYVLLGRALAAGEGLVYQGVPGSPPAAKFPPLYPLTLAAAWKLHSSFPDNVKLFEVLNLLYVALAAGALTAFQMRALKLPAGVAVGVALLGCATIDTWRSAIVPLSEPLYLLLSVGAVAVATRLERDDGPSLGLWALVVLALAGALYTRTVGVTLWAALVLALSTRRRWRHASAVAAAGIVVSAPWAAWSRIASSQLPGPLQDVLGPYGSWLSRQIVQDPGHFLASLPEATSRLLSLHVTALLPGMAPGARVAALIVLAPLAALGAISVWRVSRTAVLAPAFYLLTVWLWPFKDLRLIVPGLPWLVLLLGAGAWSVHASERPVWIRRSAAAVAVLWASWMAGQTALGLTGGEHTFGLPDRAAVLADAVEAIDRAVPTEAVVGAPDLWAGLALYSGRLAAPSTRFLPLSSHTPLWGTPDQQFEAWEAAGLDYVLVEHGGQVHGDALEELGRRCGPGSVQLIERLRGEAFLVRLPEDLSCVGLATGVVP